LPSVDVRANASFLENRWKFGQPIPGIQKHHLFRRASSTELYTGLYASQELLDIVQIIRNDKAECYGFGSTPVVDAAVPAEQELNVLPITSVSSLHVGDWVLVQYDQSIYPGEVKTIRDTDIQVSVMVRSGTSFKWPKHEDAIYYSFDKVIRKIERPILKSSRGLYTFIDKW
jgi:hypothetical protein